MSAFQPVDLPDERRPNGRISQTALRHYAACPRSGYLYLRYRGEAKTREMVRGTALHSVLERAVRTMVANDEPTIPPEIVKTIVHEVLSEQQVPVEEHDYIREGAHRWASSTALVPSNVIAVETLLVLDMGGYEVRMKVDYAESIEDGAAVIVRDYKSSRAMPAQEEIARRRPDGTLAAKAFQLILYALGLAFGVPVRVEVCECTGTAQDARWALVDCPVCGGSGRVEIREPFPLAARAQRFDLEYVFPGIDIGGEMGVRSMSLTRLELEEYRASLLAVLANLARSEETGDWPAVVSDAACGECPASSLCPIPVELRDHRGTINSAEEAAEAAAVLDREKAEHRARQAELRAWAKANGGEVVFGRKVWELVTSESEQIANKDAMFDAIERSRLYGEPFERERFVVSKSRTEFKARDLTVEELAALAVGAEGSNEGESDGGDAERSPDERWGADAPF